MLPAAHRLWLARSADLLCGSANVPQASLRRRLSAHLTYVRSMRDSRLDRLNSTQDTHIHTMSSGPRPRCAKQMNTYVKSPLHYPKASSTQDVTQLPSDSLAMA